MSASYPNREGPSRVSIHGGHSGQFCVHAKDSLEEIIKTYIAGGFPWVGITEHMPPVNDRFRYPDEIECGLSAEDLHHRFSQYISICRLLQKKYASNIQVAVGFETETHSGTPPFIERLLSQFQPDYIVGSVHHVNDVNFDFDSDRYQEATAVAGGVDALYIDYFDSQYEMISTLRPAVVGHFDLIRIYDPAYMTRIEQPEIKKRILRNLDAIRELGLILDFNSRALYKGAAEPYVSKSILAEARRMGISVVPGDDSHGVATVGYGIEECMAILVAMGFSLNWKLP